VPGSRFLTKFQCGLWLILRICFWNDHVYRYRYLKRTSQQLNATGKMGTTLTSLANGAAEIITNGLIFLWDVIKWTAIQIKNFICMLGRALVAVWTYFVDELLPKVTGKISVSDLKKLKDFVERAKKINDDLPEIQRILLKCEANSSQTSTQATVQETLQPLVDFKTSVEGLTGKAA